MGSHSRGLGDVGNVHSWSTDHGLLSNLLWAKIEEWLVSYGHLTLAVSFSITTGPSFPPTCSNALPRTISLNLSCLLPALTGSLT